MKQRALVCLLLWAVCAAGFAAEVEGLRVWSSPERTRTVLDLNGPVDYRLFTLEDPHRVVVDLRDSRLESELEAGANAGDLLRRVRTGRRSGGDLRVVFDLGAAVNPKSFLLAPAKQYGHRLVVDLRRRDDGPAQPVKTAESVNGGGARDVVVAVDAGHGGEDPGAIGPSGLKEKNVVLDIARRLARLIEDKPGMAAVLIRDGDYYVPLRERFQKAREHKADYFLSMHADAFYERSVRGSSVYVLSEKGASSEAARWLAQRENQADLVGGVRLDDKDEVLASVLLDLSQSAAMDASTMAAKRVLASLKTVGAVHKHNVEKANFMVLKSPDVPSLLVETAFISNPQDERRLKRPQHRQKIARAVGNGLFAHVVKAPPPGTWLARHDVDAKHVVARGETLSGIAERYDVNLTTLRAANDINGDHLRAGAVLTIPAAQVSAQGI